MIARLILCSFGLCVWEGCGARHVSTTISCGPGTTLTGDVCLPADTTGRLVCGLGTHEEALACIPDAPELSCGAGTERQALECVALDATLYDVRLPVLEIPADGYSKIPVLAIGRLADGTPATDAVIFGLSRPNAGTFVSPTKTLTPMGIVSFFTPCNSAQTPTCTGAFTATLALAAAPATLVGRSVEVVLAAPSGVGTPAACSGGGNVLFFDGDVTDPIHPGIDTITVGLWSVTADPAATPDRVQVGVVPSDSGQGSSWQAVFSSETLSQTLVAQVYDDAQRVDYAAPGHPGMDVSGNGVWCNTLTGRFQVVELEVTGGTTLTRFTATFEQHCGVPDVALRGCVHFEQ